MIFILRGEESNLMSVKLRRKLPLLLERVGVRRIKNKEKYFILIPSSQPSPGGRRSEA